MKQATLKIINEFPYLEEKINEVIQKPFPEELLGKVENDIDRTFITLAYFFENPNSQLFTLSMLYQHLENSWLEFALQLISFYFEKDTFLIQQPTHSVLHYSEEEEEYLTQSDVARFLKEKGLKYDSPNKIAVYYERGKFPKEDKLIAGKKYWTKKTIEAFANTKIEDIKK